MKRTRKISALSLKRGYEIQYGLFVPLGARDDNGPAAAAARAEAQDLASGPYLALGQSACVCWGKVPPSFLADSPRAARFTGYFTYPFSEAQAKGYEVCFEVPRLT